MSKVVIALRSLQVTDASSTSVTTSMNVARAHTPVQLTPRVSTTLDLFAARAGLGTPEMDSTAVLWGTAAMAQ